jgi:hypothetical protein
MFQPVIPSGGLLGWQFLQRTLSAQKAAFSQSVQIQRQTTHFKENIAAVKTADDLMADRRLLTVALGAYGLDADINSKAFIQKVLEEGSIRSGAFANRLADKRYSTLAASFGFGDLGRRTNVTTFGDEITSRFIDNQFGVAVGEVDNSLRLALNFSSGLKDVLSATEAGNARWFALMGSTPLRTVLEGALGFPSSFGSLDIDKQLEAFKARSRATLGTDSVAGLADPKAQEKLIRLFLVRSESAASAATSGQSIALTLLQAGSLR